MRDHDHPLVRLSEGALEVAVKGHLIELHPNLIFDRTSTFYQLLSD